MSALSIQPTYPIFTDIDGQPLEDGFVWIGGANLAPIGNPISVYWDAAMTIPATQPIRTRGGYPMNSGTPARLYVGTDYSIQVQNKNGSVVYSAPTATERYNEVVIGGIDASNVITTIGYTGGVQRTQQDVNDERVCVFDFMTPAQIAAVQAYTSTDNLTNAVNAAIATTKRVYLPAGKYKFNITINNKTIIEGDGSTATRVYPYDDTIAAMTYTFAATLSPLYRYWTYHSEVRNVGFYSNSSRVGVGFTFGATNPANYAANMEYANNVKFYGCYFEGLNKGVQFPFGNIGSEFYSCGFSGNAYGVYSINNKFSGDVMHAGNKHFFGGEMNSNTCAVYIHNTADGFGDFHFTDVIFEANNLSAYIYNSSGASICPVRYTNCWSEANGTNGGYTTATIDSWTGSTKGTQTLSSAQPFYVYCDNVVFEGGFVGGVNLARPSTTMTVKNCRTEAIAGVGGQTFVVVDDTSWINFQDCYTQYGFGADKNPRLVRDKGTRCWSNLSTDTFATRSRAFLLDPGFIVRASANIAGSSQTFQTAQVFAGASSGTGTVVSDSPKYANCNEFTYNFDSTSKYIYPFSYSVPSAGWYVFAVDVKSTSGSSSLTTQFSNLSTHQPAYFDVPTDSKWYTLIAVCYMDAAAAIGLWFGGMSDGNHTWRVSAAMIRRFENEREAIKFVDSKTYLE